MELTKSFEPHAIEAKWYPIWESRGWFKPTYAPGAAAYCIQLPPPNVTGTLHIGHAFQHTLMDVLIRYHRMRGDNRKTSTMTILRWTPEPYHAIRSRCKGSAGCASRDGCCAFSA